jgi:hypothetical protein
MGTFRKSLKLGKKSRQIEENLKKLDKELEKTGALNETAKTPAAPMEEQLRKFDWRREFFPEKDQYEMVNLLYEERQQKLKEAIGEEKIRIAEEVESLREAVEKKRELKQLQRVDQHLANIDVEFYKLRDDLVENINENMFPNIPAIEQKLDEILTVYGKLSERISEGFLNEPSGSPQGGDPLANTDFVTFDQLKQHYSLYLDRISTQLATLGGGGEVELKYLDDVVGIATNPSAYDGKYLKYNHTSRKFEFSDVGPIGITTELQTLNNVLGLGNTSDLGMSVGVSTFSDKVTVGGATTALIVDGNVRVVGLLTVGSGTIVIDGDNDSIGIGTVTLSETKVSQLDNLTGDTGNFSGDVKVVGVLTALSLDSSNVSVAGSITGTTFYGDGSQLTGINVGVGTTTISTESITVSGIVTASGFNGPFFVEESIDDYAYYNIPTLYTQVGGNQYARTMVDSGGLQFNPGINELWVANKVRIGGGSGIITATGFSGTSAILSGIVTAQSFSGDGSGLTGVVFSGGDIVFSGITTFNTNALFGDNRKAVFGDGSDLQIFHDGADSYISELGTGKLILNTNGPNIELKYNNTELAAKFDQDQGASLYYNNLNKFEIISAGATTYGTHYATSFSGSGASLTGITTGQITDFGNVVFGIGSSTSVVTSGIITAGAFYGDGSNLSGIATPAFVTQQIADLVDSAPTTLDTLNELAQALGDDPNFATTTTNLIGTKASLAGAAFTGSVTVTNGYLSVGSTMLSGSRLYAKERIYIGDNEDIRIYQTETGNPVFLTTSWLDLASSNTAGSVAVIRHGARPTGEFYGGELTIQDGGGRRSAVFNSGWGGVDLYHCVSGDFPTLRFSTTATGAGVVGILTADRMVGAATSNIIPFLYADPSALPSAADYHGAFAHVHSTGGAYFAHSGNWLRLVNYDATEGNVSIGTANFTTSGNIGAGIITGTSAEFRNLRLGTFGTNNIYAVGGPLYLDSDVNQVDIVNNLNVNGISTFSGRVIANDIVGLSSATFTGIVTAQSFRGDGSQLTGVGATNLNSLLDVNAPTPSAGQVLKWSGSEWQAAADLTGAGGTGIGLSDLSVTTASAGIASLSYDNTSGVFTYTPPSFAGYLSNTITQDVSMSNGYTFTYDSSATARFGSLGSNDYGDIFWGTDSSVTGFHIKNNDFDGALYLTNTGTDGVYIRATATELGASFKANAEANLYYNNVLKFSTAGLGATVYGNLQINGDTNITGVVTAAEFKGTFTGVANYASVAGVASTANYATESVTSGYAAVAGIASNLTGTPNITVGEINTTGGLFVGAGQTSSFGDRVTVRDDLSVEGPTPTLRVQDSDNAENYAYMQYDSSAGPALLFRTRAFSNTPHFIWQSEAGGGVNATQYLMYMQGGSPGDYNHGYVSFGSTVAEERLHVGGSLKVNENITAAGIITANVITATTGFNGPFYINESVDDNQFYNIPTLQAAVGGNQYVRSMVDTGALQFNPGINELWVSNNVRIGGATGIVTALYFSGSGQRLTGIPTSIVAGTGVTIGTLGGVYTINATASGISTTETLVTGGINAIGVVTATQFVGDGSGLTGIVASGSGVVIQDEGSNVGTAGTINFVGNNVSSSLSNGIATVTVSDAYAQVAGVATVAQGLTGSPDVTTGTIACSRIGVGLPVNNSYSLDIAGDVRLYGGDLWMPFGSTGSFVISNIGYVRNLSSNSGVPLALQAFGLGGGVGIGTTDGHGGVFINSPTKVVGVLTATQFVGDGSLLTGIVASGTGITIQEEGSSIGTASTINFVGAAVTATISSGTATISVSAPPPASGGKFIDNAAGIHTTSAVGVKTDLPKTALQVETFGIEAGIGTFSAVVGTPVVIDQFNVTTAPFKTAEYTVHIHHANGMQTQKVLVMQDGSAAYSNEFAIMHSSADPLVSFASTVSGGACQLQATPLTGTTGITTYRFSRGTLL